MDTLTPKTLLECNLVWRRDLTDAIKLRISRRDHPGLSGWALNLTNVLIKRRKHTEEEKTGENPMKMKGETRAMKLQAKGFWQPHNQERGRATGPHPELPGGINRPTH